MVYQEMQLENIKLNPSLPISLAAKQMARCGIKVIDLSVDESIAPHSDRDIPAVISEMLARDNRYMVSNGIPDLKDAIISKLKNDYALDYSRQEITVGTYSKQIVSNVLMATLEPGDEVVILAPYRTPYPDIIKSHGGVPKILTCQPDNQSKPRPEDLEAVISEKTRLIIITTPSYISGLAFNCNDLQGVAEVICQHPQVLVISDEARETAFGVESGFTSFAKACPELRDRIFIINAISSYTMPDWSIGYCTAPKNLIQSINKLLPAPRMISQFAISDVEGGIQSISEQCCHRDETKRDLLVDGLNKIPLFEVFSPKGADYIFCKCAKLIGKKTDFGKTLNNDTDVAMYLLQRGCVACVPGVVFGLDTSVCFSFTASEDEIKRALKDIYSVISMLQ